MNLVRDPTDLNSLEAIETARALLLQSRMFESEAPAEALEAVVSALPIPTGTTTPSFGLDIPRKSNN